MTAATAPIKFVNKRRGASGPRAADAASLRTVREVLGPGVDPARRDLLMEHLHALNDRFRHLRLGHLHALADLMKIPLVEVYEAASFYHHFEVVEPRADGRYAEAPGVTVRVCDSLACEMAGAGNLLETLRSRLASNARVVAVPCIGRCEQAPAISVR